MNFGRFWGAILVAWASSWTLAQGTLDRQVVIQPILLALDDGSNRNNPSGIFHEAALDKIYAQAGADVKVLAPVHFNSTLYNNVVTTDPAAENYYAKLMAYPGHGQHPSNTVVNVWFVNSINNGGLAGYAPISQNGIVI